MSILSDIESPNYYLRALLRAAYPTNDTMASPEQWYREIERDVDDLGGMLAEELARAIEMYHEQIVTEGVQPSRERLTGQVAQRERVPNVLLHLVAATAISAHNQLMRNQQAERVGLTHVHFSGNPDRLDPLFDQLCVGKVFTQAQVERMQNATIQPVEIFRGGWGSRLSLLPVNPNWDKDLAARVVDDPLRRIDLVPDGNYFIEVYCSAEEAMGRSCPLFA